jgi:hypothetical protein
LLPDFPDQACQSISPDTYFERVLLNVDPLDEQLRDSSLLGGEQLVQTVAKSASRTVTSRSVWRRRVSRRWPALRHDEKG